MTDADWKTWVTKHASMFGLFKPEQITTLNSWRSIFTSYSVGELLSATDRIARNPPKFLNEHLGDIHSAIKEIRAVDYKREFESNIDRGVCTSCGGSGRVVVPLLKSIVNGEWRPIRATRSMASYYTQAVLCECALGKWMGDRMGVGRDGNRRVMTSLRIYEANNPNWRTQMSERSKQRFDSVKAVMSDKERKWWSGTIDRLMAMVGMRRGDAAE